MRAAPERLGVGAKALLAARIWFWLVVVRVRLREKNLARLVQRLTRPARRVPPPGHVDARRMGRIVHEVLWVGPFRPRCLLTALVLFRLLSVQGDRPQLVIGLPSRSPTKDAHAWVEVEGVDAGPPPGRGTNEELVRYG